MRGDSNHSRKHCSSDAAASLCHAGERHCHCRMYDPLIATSCNRYRLALFYCCWRDMQEPGAGTHYLLHWFSSRGTLQHLRQ